MPIPFICPNSGKILGNCNDCPNSQSGKCIFFSNATFSIRCPCGCGTRCNEISHMHFPSPPPHPKPAVIHSNHNPFPGMRWYEKERGKHILFCPYSYSSKWNHDMLNHALHLYSTVLWEIDGNHEYIKDRLIDVHEEIPLVPKGPGDAIVIVFDLNTWSEEPGPYFYPF